MVSFSLLTGGRCLALPRGSCYRQGKGMDRAFYVGSVVHYSMVEPCHLWFFTFEPVGVDGVWYVVTGRIDR